MSEIDKAISQIEIQIIKERAGLAMWKSGGLTSHRSRCNDKGVWTHTDMTGDIVQDIENQIQDYETALTALRAQQSMPYPIGATVYLRTGYRDRVVEPYKVLGYNIRAYGVTIVLYPDDPPPQGDVPLHRRADQVYATAEDAERGEA